MQLLIVDDEIHAVRGIKAGVDWEKLGFEKVHEAFNIRQAKEVFTSHNIDILICDIEMPEGDGFELLSWKREYYPDCESLFLTCHADFVYAQKAIQLGSMDYLLKPVRFTELEKTVQKAIDKLAKEREMLRFNKTYKRYYHLWESFQPMVIEHFWQDLIQRSIPATREHIAETIAKQNIPYQVSAVVIPILIGVQRWHKKLTPREERIMEYALRNSLEECGFMKQVQGQIVQVKSGALLVVLPEDYAGSIENEQLRNELGGYIEACTRYFFCDISCYIGTPVNMEGVPDMFDVLSAMEARNVTRTNILLFLSEENPHYDTIPLPKMNAWSEMLKYGRTKGLLEEIDHYFDGLLRMERLDASLLRGFYEDFLQMIHHVLHHKGLRSHQVFSGELLSVQASTATRSVADLKQWVTALIEETSDYLHNVDVNQSIVGKVKRYVAQHLQEDISCGGIANWVNMNPDYLTRLFKKETGLTVSDYILQERMDVAKTMLARTDLPIGDIAGSVGFNNFSYFSKMFKKVTSVNPQDYRKIYQS